MACGADPRDEEVGIRQVACKSCRVSRCVVNSRGAVEQYGSRGAADPGGVNSSSDFGLERFLGTTSGGTTPSGLPQCNVRCKGVVAAPKHVGEYS